MSTIALALRADGPSILEITAKAGVFTLTESRCVEELWKAYQDEGGASGYTFLACRDGG